MSSLYLLDANAISDAMKGQPNMVAKVTSNQGSAVTSVIVKGEIRFGLVNLPPGKRRTNLEAKAAAIFGAMTAEPITEAIALQYAATRSTLEKQGFLLGDNDLWIAATALSIGAILVTRDQDFRHVQGLRSRIGPYKAGSKHGFRIFIT